MAKYKKNKGSANKRKRKEFSTAHLNTPEMLSYLDTMPLGEYQRKIQDALELERDEIGGRAWDNHQQRKDSKQNNVIIMLVNEKQKIDVYGDRERLKQVMVNLIDNAIKYNKPNGWVRI